MSYREIYFFVEGTDDERFITAVVKPTISEKYHYFSYQYSGKSTKKIKDFLKSIKSINFADYLFLNDINRSPCVTAKKQSLKNRYKPKIDENKIVIVVKEIESWYLSGVDDKTCNALGIKPFQNTNAITKEHFNQLIPKKFDSRIDFMLEALKRFDIETAKKKNKSFKYFMEKIEQSLQSNRNVNSSTK